MMNQKLIRNVLALCMAAMLACIAPGCAARTVVNAVVNGILPASSETVTPPPVETEMPSEGEEPVLPEPGDDNTEQAAADRLLVPFPDMLYTRPSIDNVVFELNSIADRIRQAAGDDEAVMDLIGQATSTFDSYETELTLARIHNAMDHADAYWMTEYDFCSSGYGRIRSAYREVQRAVEDITSSPGESSVSTDRMIDATGFYDLIERHSQLSNEYEHLLSTLTADLDGESFTFTEITTGRQNEVWHEQNARRTGDVYVELLKVRRQLAQSAGYETYVDYVFDMSDSGYTREMVEDLLNRIASEMAPLSAGISNTQAPRVGIPEDQMLELLRSWMPRLDESMGESLSLMTDYQLYDFTVGPYKDPTAFTTYLPSYAAPFLMASYTGDFGSLSTVLHEFGHFNNYACYPEAYLNASDIGEVFSTALPLLSSRFFSESFPMDEAYQMEQSLLHECLQTFPYQSYFVGFELAAYSLPEDQITYENLCAISEEQWYRFGQPRSSVAAVDWTSTIHLVDSPLYVLSYVLATDVAMQIWEMSLADPDAAMDVYYNLMQNAADGVGFMDNVQMCGLASPFADGEISTQAAYLSAVLVTGMTPENAHALLQPDVGPVETAEPTPVPTPEPTPVPTETQPAPAQDEPDAEESRPRVQQYFGYSDGHYVIPIG